MARKVSATTTVAAILLKEILREGERSTGLESTFCTVDAPAAHHEVILLVLSSYAFTFALP